MMDMPDTCLHCNSVNMIDWQNLETRPVSNLIRVEGYKCPTCQRWKPLFYSNRLMDESMKKLASMSPAHKSFSFLLSKALKRAEFVNAQMRGYPPLCVLLGVAWMVLA